MKDFVHIFLSILILLMLFLGYKAYKEAIHFEKATTKIVSYQNPKDQAKLQLSKMAKSLFGNLYEDEKSVALDTLKQKQQDAMLKSQVYTLFFVFIIMIILISFFFIDVRDFTLFGSISAMVTLIFGLITPILMVTIHKDIQYLGDIVLSFESKGVIGSIIKLFQNGDIVVALVILLFSVLVPISKVSSLIFISVIHDNKLSHKIVKFFKMIGKWSMVDVFVVAVFLVYLTTNKGDVTKAQIEVGLYFFLSYVIVSMLVSISAEKMLEKIKE